MDLTNKYVIIFLISLLLLLLVIGIIIFHHQKLESFLELLTLDEKIGQIFMIAPVSTSLDKELKELIKKYHIGNIKIFGKNYRNKKELFELIVNLQNTALKYNKGIPMFIATDQEGGWIAHLKKGFTIPPSNMGIGNTDEPRYAYIAGKIIASELSAVGINVNFAPVVDLYLNPKNWVIGPRAYSSDPYRVTLMANEFITVHHKFNVLPVIKHYPGHGRVKGDSHIEVLTNYADYDVLAKNELYPFLKLCKCDINGIMTAHIAVPELVKYIEKKENKNYKRYYYLPATISEILVKKYLLEYNNTKSLIFSDEIGMKGITTRNKIEDAVYRAIKAGVNIIVIDRKYKTIKRILKYIKQKYYKDEEFRNDIDNSVKKIIEAKALLFSHLNKMKAFSARIFHLPEFKLDYERLKIINSEKNRFIAYTLSIVTTEVYRNKRNLIPLNRNKELREFMYIVISSTPVMYKAVKKYAVNAKFINLKRIDFSRILDGKKSIIVFGLHRKRETEIIKKIYKKNRNIIVINFLHPYNIKSLKYIDTIICTYSDNPLQIEAAIEVMFNGKKKTKKLLAEYLTF